MLSLMIAAKEGRDVEGAYLHADMEDFVILKLVGEAVDIMCQVNPKYKKFVVVEHGKKVLYLQLLNIRMRSVRFTMVRVVHQYFGRHGF